MSEAPSTSAHPEPKGASTLLARALDAVLVRLVNPLVSIELAAAFRRKRFLAAFSITLAVVVAILVLVLVASIDRNLLYPSKVGQSIFLAFNITLVLAMALLFPAFASVSIVEERVNRSLDLLVTTRLAPWEIFFGKWAASFVYSVTFLAGTLPIVGLAFLLGGVEPQALVTLGIFATALAAVVASIGTFASSATSSLLRAVLASYFLSLLFGLVLVWGSMLVYMRHVAGSTGLFDALGQMGLTYIYDQGGDLIYASTALLYVGTGLFFAIVGTNRLSPPSHDRSTRLRAFLALTFGAAGLLAALGLRRAIALSSGVPQADALYNAMAAIVVHSVWLFFVVIVFSTESRELSRRVQAELAARFRLSPMRLLAPGPARGALFAIALSALLLLGTAYDARFGMGIGRVPGSERVCERGDLAPTDLAWTLLAFLSFLASLGRLLALRSKGVVWPRVVLVALTVVLALGPLVSYAVEEGGSRRWRASTPQSFPATSVTRGYVLSPILAATGVAERPSREGWIGAFYVFPERLPSADMEPRAWIGGKLVDVPYSESEAAAMEAQAIPLHRATAALYAVLALILWLRGSILERRIARGEAQALARRAEAATAPAAREPVGAPS